MTSPGSQSATTSKGRQQTSQSVVKRCVLTVVSIISSKVWPQKGQLTFSETCILKTYSFSRILAPDSARFVGSLESLHIFEIGRTLRKRYTESWQSQSILLRLRPRPSNRGLGQ